MDYHQLLDGACEMGYRLLGCGAEIYRVEDTIRRLCRAYGVEAQVFAIPNCLIVSIKDAEGRQYTQMRQAKISGTDLCSLEAYNALSRKLCACPPKDTGDIRRRLDQVSATVKPYPFWVCLLGFFIGAGFFTMFYGGGWADALLGGLIGVLTGACSAVLGRAKVNFFINTMVSGFVLALVAYGLYGLGLPFHVEAAIVGATLVLVPGLVFTNFLSDLLTGDIVAGLSTCARALLTASAIALGTGAAGSILQRVVELPAAGAAAVSYSPLLVCVWSFLGCLGFCFPFNIHGKVGIALCCLGGAIGWGFYLLVELSGGGVYMGNLVASMAVAIYANVLSRVRKCPVTPYLVVSYFPLVPGYTLYRTMCYAVQGDTWTFVEMFIRTFGIAASIALGTLFVSTGLHILRQRKEYRNASL